MPKADAAIAFYAHFGFIPLQGHTDRMILPAAVFQKKYPASGQVY